MKRKWEDKVKKVEQLAAQYERKPLCTVYKPKLYKVWQPASTWNLFFRQSQAFSFAKNCKEDVHVFALERENKDNGRRIYLVTTYTELWFYYYKHRKTLMHCYEVIPENSVCKLYFDLEFYKPANPGADGKKKVAQLIDYICRKLGECYGIRCSAKDVLNLESSTENKFSRHLIFLLESAAFKDNIHAGNFIKMVLDPARLILRDNADTGNGTLDTLPSFSQANIPWAVLGMEGVGTNIVLNSDKPLEEKDDLSFLVVNAKDGGKQLFVDLGVYTKNRNFRLYMSSKLGKNVFLEVADDNAFVAKPQKNICFEEHIFLSSLVSNVRFSDTLKILTCCDLPEKNNSQRPDATRSCISGETITGYQSSPYPEIDGFILSLVNNHGVQGGIRHWNYFCLEELLVYDISKYHWCENIGRAHKSNNIMLLVDLKREVWYQKCHDPVCKGQNFKSNWYMDLYSRPLWVGVIVALLPLCPGSDEKN
ncbi:DNA-directed primase/polymerase protein isoform X2 [Ambystoma mexicanum]|uniref:DNA-directed primase/polymerase protein isoform X2 n=1 Tax=Ambystoma mexicanum TaxID=8296 RepID=UPI0037E825BC